MICTAVLQASRKRVGLGTGRRGRVSPHALILRGRAVPPQLPPQSAWRPARGPPAVQCTSRHLVEQHLVDAGGEAGPRWGGWWAAPPPPPRARCRCRCWAGLWPLEVVLAAPALQPGAWVCAGVGPSGKDLALGSPAGRGLREGGAERTAQASPASRPLPGQPHLLLGLRVRQGGLCILRGTPLLGHVALCTGPGGWGQVLPSR